MGWDARKLSGDQAMRRGWMRAETGRTKLGRTRTGVVLGALMALAGCAGASDAEFEEISRTIAYRPSGSPSATLITSQEVNGSGEIHAALVVKASQQVIYDPSGSFIDPGTRRIGDALYGVTPEILEKFALHQADRRHNAVLQTASVDPESAETLLQRVRRAGGAFPGFCAATIADVISGVGPFASVRETMWPSDLSEDFASIEGVETRIVTDDDDFSKTSNE